MEDFRYPIGRFERPEKATREVRQQWIEAIESAPGQLQQAVAGLSQEQLDTPYRPRGWTIRQVVHHITDSHLNGYVRTKWALTEDNPAIKTYEQNRWAESPEARTGDVELSLPLLESLHGRWSVLLRSFEPETWSQTFQHPDWGTVSLDFNVALYAWHGAHHIAHITTLRKRNGW